MGRKKGKQRGHFSSKAQRAEATHQHRSAVASSSWVDPRYCASRPTNTSSASGSQKSQLQQLREERGTVSLTHLRGLLRERRMEDTIEYQQARRRNMTRPSPSATGGGSTATDPSKGAKQHATSKRHEPGWILHYEDVHVSKHRQKVSSLQSICIQALGPVLSAYTDAYGVDEMRSILDTLPPEVLTELSICVSSSSCEGGVDDALVTVLGLHNHVERLALHSIRGRVTAKGILSIVPRIVDERQTSDVNDIGTDSDEELVESWEDSASSVTFEGCTRLSRLELCNLQIPSDDDDSDYECTIAEEKELVDAVTKLLRLCPKITHLSLSGSFSSYQNGYYLLQSIPLLLPKCQVLDLSHCSWIDCAILHAFLFNLARTAINGKEGSVELRMINVAGCPHITEETAQLEEKKFNSLFPISRRDSKIIIATQVESNRR